MANKLFHAYNSSSPAFYKKYRDILGWRTEKKFLELGLENAPKMYSHNMYDPSITMEMIPGVTPDSLCEKWFEVFKKHLNELNEVADITGWVSIDDGPDFYFEESMKRLAHGRTVLRSTVEIEKLGKRIRLEYQRIKNTKWNYDNYILGSLDYGRHNTLCYNGEYRLIDFEHISYVELSTFAVNFWFRNRKQFDDSKLIEELSQYQVNDAWIEQYYKLKLICRLESEINELIRNS